MRLRSQLAVAFFLLAVLPLSGITLYSYHGSQRAIRGALESEATVYAKDMEIRVERVAEELESRLTAMKKRPTRDPQSAFEKRRQQELDRAATVELRLLLRMIVSGAAREQGAIPFAVDGEGRLYASDAREEALLAGLGFGRTPGAVPRDTRDWVIAYRRNQASGIVIGVARPVGGALRELRRTAGRNLALGLGLALVAALGILPLSRRMTRHLAALTEGAERLARGERDVRVPVPHGREFGRLAQTFNRMARELRADEERRLEQARMRKELEIGRRIQEELLPRAPLCAPFAEVSGVSIPAREVSGDFFNYFVLPDDQVAILIGDVSGKGVPAALLMASLQATIRARLALERDLARLVDTLDREMDSSEPLAPYFTLFLAVLDGRNGRLRYVNGGHNTQFVVHRESVERLSSTGRPPGLYAGGGYEQRAVELREGDALFLFTDGLVEAEDESDQPFGAERLEALLRLHVGLDLGSLMARIAAAVRDHRGPLEARDDATMVALRYSDGGFVGPRA